MAQPPTTKQHDTADISERMHQQMDLTFNASSAPSPSEVPSGPKRASALPPAAPRPHRRIPRWLERVELFLRVLLRMYIGLAVCYAPWSHNFWDQNALFLKFPFLGSIAALGAVRGLVSGLGLLNLWIAFQDAIHYRDR